MSNYRVRQVLALDPMPERQLRFLIALATWMTDHTRMVRVGFGTLITDTGRSHNTVRAARRELESAGKLASTVGRGPGNLTVWVVLCLPETAGIGTSEVGTFTGDPKGTSEVGTFAPVDNSAKGTNPGSLKVPTEAAKRYQPESADQQEPESGLNSQAKSLGFLSQRDPASDASDDERETADFDDEDDDKPDPDAALLAAAVPGADPRDVEGAVTTLQYDQYHGRIRSVRAYLRTIIANGDAQALIDQAAAERRRSEIEMARYGDPFGGPAQPAEAERIIVGEVIREDVPGDLAALRQADPSATAGEAAAVIRVLRQRPRVRDAAAVLRSEVKAGNGYRLLEEGRQLLASEQARMVWDSDRATLADTGADDEADDARAPVSLGQGLATFHTRAAGLRNGTRPAPKEATADVGQGDKAAPWLKVACLHCDAESGKPCVNQGTGRPTSAHGVRIKTAEKAAQVETP